MKNSFKQLLLLTSLTAVVHGQTSIIDFNTNDQGGAIEAGTGVAGSGYDLNNLQPYANIYGNNQGVTFTSTQDLTVYDTEAGSGEDTDLEPNYEGGNNAADFTFGNALIIQEDRGGLNIDTPNDAGLGGSFSLNSDLALSALAFDILDVDDAANVTLTFVSSTGVEVEVGLELFEDATGNAIFSQDDVAFGDGHSNNITVTVDDLEAQNVVASPDAPEFTDIVRVDFTSTTSGALAEVELTLIPEPSSTLLAGVGMLTLAFRRKR